MAFWIRHRGNLYTYIPIDNETFSRKYSANLNTHLNIFRLLCLPYGADVDISDPSTCVDRKSID